MNRLIYLVLLGICLGLLLFSASTFLFMLGYCGIIGLIVIKLVSFWE